MISESFTGNVNLTCNFQYNHYTMGSSLLYEQCNETDTVDNVEL